MSSVMSLLRSRVFGLLRVTTFEQLIKRLVWVGFWVVLLLPLVIIPAYFLLHTIV